jgi:hypothetical protein
MKLEPSDFPPELVAALAERVAEQIGHTSAERSPWMTVPEAADYLRWKPSRIQKRTGPSVPEQQRIPHRKHEGRLLFHRDELDAWLEDFREGPA